LNVRPVDSMANTFYETNSSPSLHILTWAFVFILSITLKKSPLFALMKRKVILKTKTD
jgi:hypothetical protein